MTEPRWITLFLDTPLDRWQLALDFWAAVTGCEVSESRGERDQFVTLLPRAGDAWLKLQAIEASDAGMHLDLDSGDRPAAIQRSRAAGARDAWTYQDVTVMRSPGGLPFCHTAGEPDRRIDRSGLAVIADQMCLDIPSRLWDAEIEFWQRLTGRPLQPGEHPESADLRDPDPSGPARILLQRLDGDRTTVAAHLDLAARDRSSEIARHQRLGARRIGDFEHWTSMLAPSGHVYCITDRDPATGRGRDDRQRRAGG